MTRRFGERPGSSWRVLFLVIAVAAVAVSAYVAGANSLLGDILGVGTTEPPQQEYSASELATVRNQLTLERKRHELDRHALEMVRTEIAGGKTRVAELEEELRFYRSLMSPDSVKKGVSLRAPELVQGSTSDTVAFRIVVQQKAHKHAMVKGSLIVRVSGMLAGQQVSYPLSELANTVEDESVVLQFRYFQTVEGELIVPQGFEPMAISLTVTTKKPQKLELGETYPWQLQEQFSHVGK